jgi:hypothetical protein
MTHSGTGPAPIYRRRRAIDGDDGSEGDETVALDAVH